MWCTEICLHSRVAWIWFIFHVFWPRLCKISGVPLFFGVLKKICVYFYDMTPLKHYHECCKRHRKNIWNSLLVFVYCLFFSISPFPWFLSQINLYFKNIFWQNTHENMNWEEAQPRINANFRTITWHSHTLTHTHKLTTKIWYVKTWEITTLWLSAYVCVCFYHERHLLDKYYIVHALLQTSFAYNVCVCVCTYECACMCEHAHCVCVCVCVDVNLYKWTMHLNRFVSKGGKCYRNKIVPHEIFNDCCCRWHFEILQKYLQNANKWTEKYHIHS